MRVLKTLSILVIVLVLLSSCSGLPTVDLLGQDTECVTRDCHAGHIVYYERMKLEISKKISLHQSIIDNYESHSEQYGRAGLDIESHAQANLRHYQDLLKAVEIKLEFHRGALAP